MFSYTKHSIALRWSQTFPGKLETEFSANEFLIIPSNIRGHSKLSSTNVEKPTMFRNEKELRSEIGIVLRLGFLCYTHLQSYSLYEAVSHKNYLMLLTQAHVLTLNETNISLLKVPCNSLTCTKTRICSRWGDEYMWLLLQSRMKIGQAAFLLLTEQ